MFFHCSSTLILDITTLNFLLLKHSNLVDVLQFFQCMLRAVGVEQIVIKATDLTISFLKSALKMDI